MKRQKTSVSQLSERHRRLTRVAAHYSKVLALGAVVTASTASLGASLASAEDIVGVGNLRVGGNGACVEIKRDPFHMRFFNTGCSTGAGSVSGTPVLEQVAPPASKVLAIEGYSDIEPNGTQSNPDVALYAPLVYEVGGQLLKTFNRTAWIGNMYTGGRSGNAYAPVAVLRAEKGIDLDGNGSVDPGMRLTLSTSEPPPFPGAPPEYSRLMFVTLMPDGAGAIRVRASFSYTDGVINLGDSFATDASEAFRGFGGRHAGVNARGRRFYSWVEQENLGGGIIEQQATANATATAIPLAIAQYAAAGYPIEIATQLGTEAGTAIGLQQGREYMYPNGPMAAYYPQNLFVSSKPYGLLVANPELTRWRLQNADQGKWQFSVAVPWVDASQPSSADPDFALDYTVAVGATNTVIANLTRINGRNALPPEWAEGPTISRTVQLPLSIPNPYRDPNLPPDPTDLINVPGTGDSPDSYWQKVQNDLTQIETLNLPVSAYAFEGWSVLKYAHDENGQELGDAAVQQVIARLHARKIRAIAYVRPYFSVDGLLTQDFDDYAEVTMFHLVAKAADGSDYVWRDRNDAVLLDLNNPYATEWLSQRLVAMLDLGFDGFHSDFGEQVTDDMYFVQIDGMGNVSFESGLTMHNKYPVLLSTLTRNVTTSYQAAHPQRGPIFFFSRSGYSAVNHCAPNASGVVACSRGQGSAAADYANHPGDATTDWTVSSGIASQIPDMLNRGIGGNYGFNIDIGGYADFVGQTANPYDPNYYQGTSKELFIRWTQLAALTPFFRVHNSGLTGVRQPWSFDAETLNIWKQMAALHKLATPYIRSAWNNALSTGTPIMRPMWLAFPTDNVATNLDQQYLLGADILVAPIVTPAAANPTGKHRVYLPVGLWLDPNALLSNIGKPANQREPVLYNNASTGRWIEVPSELNRLPFFLRANKLPFDANTCLSN